MLEGFLYLQRVGTNLHCDARAPRCSGFSYCIAQTLGAWTSVVVVHQFSCSAALEIFWARDQTHVTCICRRISNHWTTREVWVEKSLKLEKSPFSRHTFSALVDYFIYGSGTLNCWIFTEWTDFRTFLFNDFPNRLN